MYKKIELIRKVALWVLLIVFLINLLTGTEVAAIGAVLFAIFIYVATERQKAEIIRRNPYKVKARIEKSTIGRDSRTFTVKYEVDGKEYNCKVLESDMLLTEEHKYKEYELGDMIEVYTSKDLPNYVIPSCEKVRSQQFAYVAIMLGVTIMIFSFLFMFMVGAL